MFVCLFLAEKIFLFYYDNISKQIYTYYISKGLSLVMLALCDLYAPFRDSNKKSATKLNSKIIYKRYEFFSIYVSHVFV